MPPGTEIGYYSGLEAHHGYTVTFTPEVVAEAELEARDRTSLTNQGIHLDKFRFVRKSGKLHARLPDRDLSHLATLAGEVDSNKSVADRHGSDQKSQFRDWNWPATCGGAKGI